MGRLTMMRVERLPLGARVLRLGSKGRDVAELQKTMIGLGFFDIVSGEYCYLTEEAIKTFQKRYHLRADGIVGPATIRMLKEAEIWEKGLIRRSKLLEEAAFFKAAILKADRGRREVMVCGGGRADYLQRAPGAKAGQREIWTGLEAEEIQDPNKTICEQIRGYSGLLAPDSEDNNLLNSKATVSFSSLWERGRETFLTRRRRRRKNGDREREIRYEEKSVPMYQLFFPPLLGQEKAPKEQSNEILQKRGVVYDLRAVTKVSAKIKKSLSRPVKGGEVYWWIDSTMFISGFKPPGPDKADGIIYSPTLSTTPRLGYLQWTRGIKSLLMKYPCTRVMACFNLWGVEKGATGAVRKLSPEESRFIQRYSRFFCEEPKTDGWRHLRYQSHGEEREALLSDRKTVKSVLEAVDQLNLKGVLFFGEKDLLDPQDERDRFVMAPKAQT